MERVKSSALARLGPHAIALVVSLTALGACGPPVLSNDPNAHVPLERNPSWQNWSENLVHLPTSSDENYYFSPTNLAELQAILAKRPEGVGIRVSGQRHSQAPLVASDQRSAPENAKTWLLDLSCYADLGPAGDQDIVVDVANNQVTVNAGVREDALDAALTEHNLMLATVTAGGFFSIGGMTAIDVHGASLGTGIFAETASAYTLVDANGAVTTLDTSTPAVGDWSPLQFARVSLGALGVVTSVTLDVLPRPYATTLEGSHERHKLDNEADFVARYTQLLADHERIESFFNPYSHEFLALIWDANDNPAKRKPNRAPAIASACTFAQHDQIGAPLESKAIEGTLESLEEGVQRKAERLVADALVGTALLTIESQVKKARKKNSDLWLQEAARVVFMAYFFELPSADAAGLAKAWEALHVVEAQFSDEFIVGAPLEFRFMRAGDSAMAGTYSTNPDALFVNIEMIAFVQAEPASDYPEALLSFFSRVEREWVALGGFPHNGKAYGFYDPSDPDTATGPFNPGYLKALAERRGARFEAFEDYRQSRDPEGVFCNDFLGQLGLCREPEPEPEAPSTPAAIETPVEPATSPPA